MEQLRVQITSGVERSRTLSFFHSALTLGTPITLAIKDLSESLWGNVPLWPTPKMHMYEAGLETIVAWCIVLGSACFFFALAYRRLGCRIRVTPLLELEQRGTTVFYHYWC